MSRSQDARQVTGPNPKPESYAARRPKAGFHARSLQSFDANYAEAQTMAARQTRQLRRRHAGSRAHPTALTGD